MSQSTALVDALKQVLRKHRVTYAQVAKHLGLSEGSVKRLFSSGGMTLERLESICELVDVELSDLFHEYERGRTHISHLTVEQEKELVASPRLLLVAMCVRNHIAFEDMVNQYQLTEAECIQALANLDRLKFLDLLPGNRIKMRIAPDFHWLPNGPVVQYYAKRVQEDFFNSRFTGDHEARRFVTGMLSRASREILLRKIDHWSQEFAQLQREDLGLAVDERTNVGLLLATRPWKLEEFASSERNVRAGGAG
ncbi:helix-turn-helix domain-containing protein [Sedimenticola thiotaurini]|uniref:HTH cro/C1-type domain-containing protein n=1 Tax=Sedimenticola thiotaurini TaxID=1543721 RepID=A0A0F7JVF8_9GAMM|nr:helix-turn-helix transcriptional regulator [Sedimenticola thiotaurini]AKH20546.1 hypothetical protein AAY24_09480 [Sedimenticola thiotaurini]